MNREASSELWNLSGNTNGLWGAMVTRLLHEMLLFYCLVAVTGIVIAGVTLLG